MREGAAAVRLPQRPDSGHVGSKLVIDRDETALVGRDAGLSQAEIVRVGRSSDGEQKVRAAHLLVTAFAVHAHAHTVPIARGAQAFRAEPEFDTLALEDGLHFRRHVLVFARDEARPHFDHRDATAEAAVHLGELEPDVAPADDQEVLGQEIDVHHARIVEVLDFIQSLDAPHGRASSDVEENLRALRASGRSRARDSGLRNAHARG